MNAGDDVLFGFSESKASEYIGAFYHGRKANGVWMARPVLVQAGRTQYTDSRWGDYSATSMDPVNDSFWTVQEYADPVLDNQWGTWVSQVKVRP